MDSKWPANWLLRFRNSCLNSLHCIVLAMGIPTKVFIGQVYIASGNRVHESESDICKLRHKNTAAKTAIMSADHLLKVMCTDSTSVPFIIAY